MAYLLHGLWKWARLGRTLSKPCLAEASVRALSENEVRSPCLHYGVLLSHLFEVGYVLLPSPPGYRIVNALFSAVHRRRNFICLHVDNFFPFLWKKKTQTFRSFVGTIDPPCRMSDRSPSHSYYHAQVAEARYVRLAGQVPLRSLYEQ